jgi:DNA adenine methylase
MLLRYPGGKSKVVSQIIEMLPESTVYFEPFIGGGSVGLAYAKKYPKSNIILMDLNPMVAAFWNCVVGNPFEFINVLRPMTLEYYKECLSYVGNDSLKLAERLLILNRGSFNGQILGHSSPIGGWNQQGVYKIDCRYNLEKLKKEIIETHKLLKERTLVICGSIFDYTHLLNTNITYLDPPYVEQGAALYGKFGSFNHELLSLVLTNTSGKWLLSYDNSITIHQLYSNFNFTELIVASSMDRPVINGKRVSAKKTEYLIKNF